MFRVPALAVAVCVVAAACGGKSQQPASDAIATTAETQRDASQGVTTKLGAYIDCFNHVNARVHAGAKHYTGWMQDPFAGPTGRESGMTGPYDIDDDDMKHCDAPVSAAAAAKPSLPALDKAALQYHAALKALRPVSHEVADYYTRQDYEDDQFAKGKRLHPQLMEALSTYADASDAFSAELDVQNDAVQRQQLKTLEQGKGRTREYYRLAMMLDARQLADLLEAEQFDVTRANALLDGFNRLSDEAHAKVADQEPGKLTWNSFETAAETFRRQAKARVKRVVEKTPYSKIEQGWLDSPSLAPEGSSRKLLNTYNALVSASNRQ
ncbi:MULTISPECIES: YiiG family protein [unclassified Xanthomonas]|uniref:YiiG family protein n=1 Tax=unclassified Xanthomonas TaxID=2643310 RepID=UPI001620ECAD|nr:MULTISPECIES: YiiG family protein [unclassified Xanthomonas]